MAFPTLSQLFPVGDIDPADAKTYFTDWLTATLALFGAGTSTATTRQALGVSNRSAIAGLVQSTAGSSATITVSAGEATDGTNADTMVLASAISKTTSAWAVGTAAGGLDTGAIANSTAYYLWLIKRVDTGVVDVLISLSATAPTMPANYTLKRLIGWAKTNGSAQWSTFKCYETSGGGLKFIWALPTLELNSAVVTTARTTTTPVGLPAGFSVEASLKAYSSNASSCSVNIQCPDETDAAPSTGGPGITFSLPGGGVGQAQALSIQTSATGTLATRSTAASTTVQINCTGFAWSRR